MKTRWKQTTLGEIAEIVTGGTPSKSSPEFFGSVYPFITPTDISESSPFCSTERFLSEVGKNFFNKRILPENSICFTCIASIGKICLTTRDSFTNQQINSLIIDSTKADFRFVYYLLKFLTPTIKSHAGGTITGIINKSTFSKIGIDLPELDVQSEIADVLWILDDKIELLRAQNKTLEEMAQRLFKEWFVDFNFPNEDGKPYKKSGGRMVGSELGEIPEGWRVETFSNLVDVLSGGTPKTTMPTYWNGSIPFFTPKDAKDTFFVATTEKTITEDGLEHCNSKLYPKETVFITARGTVGKCALALSDMAMNQSCYALVGKDVSNLFVFLLTKQIIDLIKKSASGAVFDAITVSTFESLRFPLGDSSVVDQLEKIIRPMFSKISDNTEETNILSELRDQLLPKLMSGDLMTF